MSETEFNIDEAEAEYNAQRQAAEHTPPFEEPPADEPPADGPPADEPPNDDTPPGFKSFEDYVADGGDPDDYVGKKAYERHHARIQENKGLREDMRGLKDTVQQTVAATNELLTRQEAQHKSELTAALEQARQDEDVDAALDAQQGLDELEDKQAQRQQQQAQNRQSTGEHSEIQTFREANPILDATSDQFDAEFNTDVEAAFNALAQQGLTQTDAQVKRSLAAAMRTAKSLHPDKFESQRNNRGQQQARKPTRQAQNPRTPSAKDFKINNPRNGRDNDASGVEAMIREAAEDQARKSGKDAADIKKAGNEAAANFVKSLNDD